MLLSLSRRFAGSLVSFVLFVPLAVVDPPAHSSSHDALRKGMDLYVTAEPLESNSWSQRGIVRTSRAAVRTHPTRPASVGTSLRTRPGHVVVGHYIRSLTGRYSDRRAMRALGEHDARRNPRDMEHHVLLQIGGQVPYGIWLSGGHHFVSYAAVVRAMTSYVRGYHAFQRRNAPVTISLGTSNDLLTDAAAGRRWAKLVVNPVRKQARPFTNMTIAGASDIEPGFRGGPGQSKAWVRGFLASTRAPFVFNGSADGCSWTRPLSHCNNGWTARDLAAVAGTIAPSRILVLPQVYNPDMAAQWALISRTAKLTHHPPLRFIGPLTETAACGSDWSCPTMPSSRAWRLLWSELHRARVAPKSLPGQVDLDVA